MLNITVNDVLQINPTITQRSPSIACYLCSTLQFNYVIPNRYNRITSVIYLSQIAFFISTQ